MRPRTYAKILALAAPLATGGMMLQVSCSGAANLLGQVNPCGTILACDPLLYRLIAADIDSPGVRPEIDIFCSYPPFCPPDVDPILGLGANP